MLLPFPQTDENVDSDVRGLRVVVRNHGSPNYFSVSIEPEDAAEGEWQRRGDFEVSYKDGKRRIRPYKG